MSCYFIIFTITLYSMIDCLGLTAFDYIVDFEEWIECGYFTEEIKARLKGWISFFQLCVILFFAFHIKHFCFAMAFGKAVIGCTEEGMYPLASNVVLCRLSVVNSLLEMICLNVLDGGVI